MIKVKEVKFSKEFSQGDGIVTLTSNQINIFYTYGIILNDKYSVGNLRFIKDCGGNHELSSLEQHLDVPKEIYGYYRKVNERDTYKYLLNRFVPSWQIIPIDDILLILKGENTFKYNIKKYKFAQRLSELFPDINFSEVGSSNIGLGTSDSDIDIFVPNDYKEVMTLLRDCPKRFGLKINKEKYEKDLENHCRQYNFSRKEAKKICDCKLSGLEYDGHEIIFFDACRNPIFEWIFQPNCSEQAILKGKVIDDSFAGHHTVSYIIESDERYYITLIRGIFQKEKRFVIKKRDTISVQGTIVHRNPNLIIAKDLNLRH